MDTTSKSKRRSRMRRQATGKRIRITSRDIQILQLLHRYRYLRSTFIHAFVGGDPCEFGRRLRDLNHETRHIVRPDRQWDFAKYNSRPAIYELDDNGERLLRDLGLLTGETTTWLRKGRIGAHRQFAHSLMICDILASIELGTLADPRLRFISWEEIIARAPARTRGLDNPFKIPVTLSHTFENGQSHRLETSLIPDGLFGLEYEDGSLRFFALEADRASMPLSRKDLKQSSYMKKLLSYLHVTSSKTYREHFGIPNLLVLNVTPQEIRMKNMMELLEQLTSGNGSPRFLFKTMSTLGDFQQAPEPTDHMFSEPWMRSGREPLPINKT